MRNIPKNASSGMFWKTVFLVYCVYYLLTFFFLFWLTLLDEMLLPV